MGTCSSLTVAERVGSQSEMGSAGQRLFAVKATNCNLDIQSHTLRNANNLPDEPPQVSASRQCKSLEYTVRQSGVMTAVPTPVVAMLPGQPSPHE